MTDREIKITMNEAVSIALCEIAVCNRYEFIASCACVIFALISAVLTIFGNNLTLSLFCFVIALGCALIHAHYQNKDYITTLGCLVFIVEHKYGEFFESNQYLYKHYADKELLQSMLASEWITCPWTDEEDVA